MIKKLLLLLLSVCTMLSCQSTANVPSQVVNLKKVNKKINMENKEEAILAGGCFWCIETSLKLLEGVDTVISGYIGGAVENPTYAQVCTGNTGHAEAVKIVFDPQVISFDRLLEAFFLLHDPTQLNRQGNDVGTQYRSAIFPVSRDQEQKAKYYIKALNESSAYSKPVVTTVEEAEVFYIAENYHQDYYNNNPQEMYCQLVVRPKLEKFRKIFADKLR